MWTQLNTSLTNVDIEVTDHLTGPRGNGIVDLRAGGNTVMLIMTKDQLRYLRNELNFYLGEG